MNIKMPPGFWAGLGQLGIAAEDIALRAQLPLSAATQPILTAAQYYAVWQAYADVTGDTAQAIIRLAAAFETAQYPPSVLATYHARSYRDAMNRMVRYKQMCPPESLRMTEEGESCIIELAWATPGETGPPVLTGITLAFLLELGRRGTGLPLTARRVEFAQAMGDAQALEAYFGCPVRTGAAHNRLMLHRRDLDRPFLSYNEELLEILTPAVEHSLEERQPRSITEAVKWIIKRSLTAGAPDIQAAAKELGVSSRTLQRQLAGDNTSFKLLLSEARHELARLYLTDPSLDLKEVAFLIGYEDQNSFYRAFRSWEGDTPSRWRLLQTGRDPI